MSNLTKGLLLLVVIIGIGAGLVVWKNKVGGQHAAVASFNSISNEEIGLLLSDVAKSNPMALKKLAEDPEMKKQQVDNLKQLLAFASQAQKDGLADDPTNRQELQNIRNEIIAVNYDREINKDKGPMPPFGFITEDQTKAYWGTGEQPAKGFFASLADKIGLGEPDHELAFQNFLDTKVKLMKEGNPQMKDREISDEERTQAKDFFAKVAIYDKEYEDKVHSGEVTKEVQDKVNLQVKLQQAQFLARIYSAKVADKAKVTDEDIAKYIAEHPDLSPAEKKAKAEGILSRAKAGEDFAALANEFSEDPGNKDAKGEGQGGIYKDIPKGKMVPQFEAAALALEAGQITPELVETDFGYHIIKLERKGESTGPDGKPAETYDARHILIATTAKDPEDPSGREMPLKAYVRNKLQGDKEKKVLDDIIAANNVSVPDDFTVPEVTDAQIQETMKKQQQQMPQQPGMDGDDHGAPPQEVKKPEPKKPEPKKGK